MKSREPWNFCETPKEKCTMNYCDENGCQNRKRNYVEGNDLIADKVPRFKVHYAPKGEWGSSKTYCGRYWTTDVAHRALIDEVTCKRCLELL